MFHTYDQAEVFIPQGIAVKDQRSWWTIEQSLCMHWFHVTYEIKYADEDMYYSQMIFFEMLDHLIDFVSQEGHEIKEVYLVTPGHMNNSNQWQMEPLTEIWVSEEPEEKGQLAHVFVLANGNKYIDSGLRTPEDKLLNKKTILKV